MGEEERDEEAAVDAKKDRESAAAAASLDKLTDHVRLGWMPLHVYVSVLL